MNQKIKHIWGSLVLALCIAGNAQSQIVTQDLPPRDQNYLRNLVSLSGVIGGAHAVRVACNGVDDQYWRRYMQQLLGLEAPNRDTLRGRMVDAFNNGFETTQRQYRICDTAASEAEARFAARGRDLSSDLAAHYFPRRGD